jgi:hypothetical protein
MDILLNKMPANKFNTHSIFVKINKKSDTMFRERVMSDALSELSWKSVIQIVSPTHCTVSA